MTTPRVYNLQRGTRVGDYVVGEAIGLGTAQVAYLADSPDGGKVVLKISLSPKGKEDSADRRAHERFRQQVNLFHQLRGTEGVAEIFGDGMFPDRSESGHAYLAQEFVPGSVNIVDWYRKEPHPLRKIIEAWSVLATACARMKLLKVCHRDLKPENILMTPDGVPRIVDFDSAKWAWAQRLTRGEPGHWPGTEAYYSPEVCEYLQRNSNALNLLPCDCLALADLHALGVILYEVLTGEYPFDKNARGNELFEQIAHVVPRRPSKLNPEVPWGLEKVTMRLLQKDPGDRYENGSELAGDLRILLRSQEDWERPFQTPAKELRSAPTQTSRTSPSTPMATDGSAALDEAADGSPGSFIDRGMMWLRKAKMAFAAAAVMAVIACAHFMGMVRTGEEAWLAQCPPESRKAVEEFGLDPDEGDAQPEEGRNAIIPPHGGLELRDGDIEVSASIPARGGGKEALLYGVIQTGSDGASVHLTKMKLFQKGDPRGGPPSGPERYICAFASVAGTGAEPGIPKVTTDLPPTSELHPGYVFVTTGRWWLHFAH